LDVQRMNGRKLMTIPVREECIWPRFDLDLRSVTLKTFSISRSHDECLWQFHWNLSTKYRDIAVKKQTARRTTGKQCSLLTIVGGGIKVDRCFRDRITMTLMICLLCKCFCTYFLWLCATVSTQRWAMKELHHVWYSTVLPSKLKLKCNCRWKLKLKHVL